MSPNRNEDDSMIRLERETLRDVHELQTESAVIKTKVEQIEAALKELISRPEFTPVKLITYTMAGSILAGVLGALLAQVIRR